MKRLLSVLCLLLPAVIYAGSVYHVTTTGSSGNSGSSGSPWDLATALTKSSTVHGGDTIYVHAGTYNGFYNSTLNGSSGNPIVVRNYQNGWVKIDGGSSQCNGILYLEGNYVWYWGLEICATSTTRSSIHTDAEDVYYPDAHISECVAMDQSVTLLGNKCINCIIHDGYNGVAQWNSASFEMYGCIDYNNGFDAPDRTHGHNFYGQCKDPSTRQATDCIFWGAWQNEIQFWGSGDAGLDNMTFDGNVMFKTAGMADGSILLTGGVAKVNNARITNNVIYNASSSTPDWILGYDYSGGGADNCTIAGNYMMLGHTTWYSPETNITMTGNSFYLPSGTGWSQSSYPTNTYYSSRPTSNQIVIRPNAYERGRAHVAIFNWTGASSVSVDLSSVFSNGDTYRIVDAQNPLVTFATGTYSGPISINMTSSAIAQPNGTPNASVNGGNWWHSWGGTRTHTSSEFGVFLVTGGTGTPAAQAPTVVTSPASGITTTTATLNGSVNPNGQSTTYHFDYGTTTSYGSSTSSASAGSGSSLVNESAPLTGLTAGTLYHYRLVGTNSAGTTNSSDGTFTTGTAAGSPPVVSLSAASGITPTGAQLNGSVNPNGSATTYQFNYGTTSGYGSSTASSNAGSGTGSSAVNAVLSNLTPGTLYHYRLVATNSAGTTNSSDGTLTTGAAAGSPPVVSLSAASGITPTGAQLNGSVNPNGSATTYRFNYGTTSGYGSSTASSNAGSGTGSSAVNAVLSNLTPGTLYHYRLVATNSAGTTNSSDGTLTTGTAVGSPPVVSLSAASGITPTGAQLNGSVNPNGSATTYRFNYGTTSGYGSSTASSNAGSGTGSSAVNAVLSGLTPGTLYHYSIAASNNGGTTNSSDGTLTTAPAPPAPALPVVTTKAATNITTTGAELNGTVNPNGSSATYHFEYGPTTVYGSSTPSNDAGAGSSPVNVSAVLTNPIPKALYHYRLVATNAAGTINGVDLTFTGQSLIASPGHATDPHALQQNYPNPFNPSTQIQYELLVDSQVSMNVYNSLGEEVTRLFEGFQSAGSHMVQWDGKGFVSGIYFCVLKSGGMVSTRRMILLR